MTRILVSLLAAIFLLGTPARADYSRSRASFEDLRPEEQTSVALALIASGDFEAVAQSGYTPRLYRALRDFERREGYIENGVLDAEQLQRLQEVADEFNAVLGLRAYVHPRTDVRLPVPRRLFDAEKQTPEGLLFTRRDGMLSLIFLSFPAAEKSYDTLWRTLSSETEGKHVMYQRRFDSRFVVTGTFHQSKFYTMMARTGRTTTGFTFSWGAPYDALGRKVSTFLANAWLAQIR